MFLPNLHILEPEETLDSLKEYYTFPPYITLAHVFNAPRNWGIDRRSLKQYQFQYVVDGIADYWIEGQTYITRRGDLIYHRPGELHSVHTVDNNPYVCLSLLFHFGPLLYPLESLLGRDHAIGNFAGHTIENKLSLLITHYQQPGLFNHALCQGLLMQIIADLAAWKLSSKPQTQLQEKTKTKLVLVYNYIKTHYQKNIRHRDLEEISGLSRNYVIIQFKKCYGMTPFEFLAWVRIERAKELVIQTNLSIGEIANLLGYADVHTFGRMFKSKTGTSLSQFCSSIVVSG